MAYYTQSSAIKKIYTGTFSANSSSGGYIYIPSQTLGATIENTGVGLTHKMFTYSCNLQLIDLLTGSYYGLAHWESDYLDHYGYGNEYKGERNLSVNGNITSVSSSVSSDLPFFFISVNIATTLTYNYVLYIDLFLTQITE